MGTWAPEGVGTRTRLRALMSWRKSRRVTGVDGVTLAALDCSRDGLAADGHLDHVIYVANGKAVARGGFAIDGEIEEITAGAALGKGAAGIGKIAEGALDLRSGVLDFIEVGAEDLHAQHAAKSGGEHLGPGLDGHPEDVRHAGDADLGVHLGDQVCPMSFRARH